MPLTPSAQYSLTIRVEIDHKPGMLGRVASAIGQAGGTIGCVPAMCVYSPTLLTLSVVLAIVIGFVWMGVGVSAWLNG